MGQASAEGASQERQASRGGTAGQCHCAVTPKQGDKPRKHISSKGLLVFSLFLPYGQLQAIWALSFSAEKKKLKHRFF